MEQLKCSIVDALKSLFPNELRVIFQRLFKLNPQWICKYTAIVYIILPINSEM